MMAHLQVGKEKSTIHVFDEFNQHRCSSECCGPRFVISYREKNCHERSIAMGQNVLLFRHLCINNFNCSVDFREFLRYTTITNNIIVFPFYVTERSAKIMQLKCLTQNKFCSLLQCFRFWEPTYYLTIPRPPVCQQSLTVISWCLVVFLPPKAHKSNRNYSMFVLAGEPCLYRSPRIDTELCWPVRQAPFQRMDIPQFFRSFLLFLHQKEFVCSSLLLDFATLRSDGSFPCSGRVGVLAKWWKQDVAWICE